MKKVGEATKLQLTPLPLAVDSGGKLIGLDNGELEYIGDFKTDKRNAYQGRLLVSVQKSAAANAIKITATSPGLTAAGL